MLFYFYHNGGFCIERTTNYALPDWEKSDFIQMSDFNDLTHKLDTALKSHDDTLNTKADTSAVTAVQQTVCRIAAMVAHPFHLKKTVQLSCTVF